MFKSEGLEPTIFESTFKFLKETCEISEFPLEVALCVPTPGLQLFANSMSHLPGTDANCSAGFKVNLPG